jgi:beta-N-acetylhexosaminidase
MNSHLPSAALEKFLAGFEGDPPPSDLRALLADGLAGVVIFPRNFSSAQGLRSLTDEIRRAASRTPLIAIDQEGGRRFSLPEPFTQWPSATELGTLDDPAAVEAVARAMARELLAAGCNVNFAPMLDLHLQERSPVTAERSFGSDPQKVARLGEAFCRGLAAEGVLACAKHFPGHGDTTIDPHQALPVFDGALERLASTELVPFARAVAVGVPLIMTAHILLPKIDPGRPASLSRRILQDLLRKRLGFHGAIVADDLGMGALCGGHSTGESAIATFQAGSDIALLCHDWTIVRPTIEAPAQAIESGAFDETEWEQSHARIEELRARAASAPAVPLDAIGSPEHRALSRRIHDRIKQISR